MSTKFKTVITTAGAAKLAAATVPGGKKINLNVMAVGDGGGKLPVPDAGQTQLVNEVWRHTLNKISQDNRYSNYIVAELVIPPEVGGFWMRELGLYDDEGTLIAVANMAESYKPELAEGSGRAQTCRMVIIVSSVESVALSIDSTMVMATQDYVDDRLAEHEKSRRHPDATLKEKGFTQLSNATDSESETLAATPKAVKAAYDLADGKYTAQDATTTRKGIVQLSNATDSVSETLAATPKAVKVAYDLANAKYKAQDATTARKGIIQLSNATDSTSETLAATPKAVKAAMDNANGRVPSDRKVNGHPLSGDITLWASDVKAISADAIGQITDNGTMASANTPGWWRVAVSNSDTVADFPTYPDGSKLYSYGYMFVEKIGEVWFQHYYAHMGANAKRQDWGTEPNTSRQWVIDYNTVNKPSASDVGALPITGGRLNGPLGIGTDNVLGGNSIVFGDNDTGFKWHSDGVLGIYANSAQVGYIDNSGLHMLADIRATGVVRTGNGKTLTLSSGNNSALNAGLSLWGGGERPTVIELSDEQGWHLYSQRNTDGSISFTVNGIVYCNALNIGGAIYQNNGDIFGSLWGNGWLSTWIHNNVVKAVRLGPVALSGGLWRDFQLGGGQVVTGFHTDGSWEMEGGDDKVYYRPIQYLVGDAWVTAPSV
ncbi:phage tail protein [Salmonella enterica subsp. enterica serovar Virchow]|uniref:Phage tail protein n=1 Tax=Salmonella typhimurium (strain SL1344) TaxID=216597 RepID=A0A718VZW0_SALTS|nr:phage tail protein [Salmonella enterica subsp. enterica serovar Virchow]EBO7573838.1 phage tail protein [Salmonella enterica]ECN8988540.1 phage tail protein [Salmonella enterica subsp. enterica serovar Newport]EDR7426507.1 phage tail protein [Salmonella enterica subsp. enterica serovar Mikawasima]EDV9110081.1 phage tail protein [Salmonella enterica subsp. enterica]EIC0489246.1 tail fiber protein [Salmonella enterica subsp. enterica serovar Ituri]HAD6676198.1 phage tail protein [Salmonella 